MHARPKHRTAPGARSSPDTDSHLVTVHTPTNPVAQDGDLVETLRCYGCQCTWRQIPEQQEDEEGGASYSCPQVSPEAELDIAIAKRIDEVK